MVISSSLQYFMKFHCSRVRLKSQLITTLHDTTLAQNSCTVYFHRKTASTQLASTTQWKKSTIACFYQENVWLAWLYPTIRYDCYFGGWIQNTVRSTKGVSVCQATIFTYLSSEEKAFLEGVCVCVCVCVCLCVSFRLQASMMLCLGYVEGKIARVFTMSFLKSLSPQALYLLLSNFQSLPMVVYYVISSTFCS